MVIDAHKAIRGNIKDWQTTPLNEGRYFTALAPCLPKPELNS